MLTLRQIEDVRANAMAPHAIASMRTKFPNLVADVDVLKIEEAA
jgi:hypothetical protein